MEFLFVGCSITWGDELKDRLNSRYSKIICDALGANEINIAECGQSNDWIARRTVEETRKKKYDRVYVQLTVPSRLEYYTETDVHKFTPQSASQKTHKYYTQARWYYRMVWNRQYGIEHMYKNKFIIENAVDSELVFMIADCSGDSKPRRIAMHEQSYWNQLCKMEHHWIWKDMIGRPYREGPLGKREGHPLEDEHMKIANYLLNKDK